MKFLFIYLLLVGGFANINFKQLEGLNQQVGQSCQANSDFQVSGFNVSPWPLTKGVRFTITMSGTFLHNTEVSTEYILIEFNNKRNQTIIDVKAKYNQGDYESFVINDNAGSVSGVYSYAVGLHWNKILYDVVLACWRFTYQI